MKYLRIFSLVIITVYYLTPTGPAAAAANAVGTNISDSSGTVYTITTENGTTVKRPYTSAGAYLSFNFNNWGNVVTANSDDLTLPTGSFIPPRDGTIFCSDRGTDRGTCYLISQGKKSGFTSEAVFKQLGFDFNHASYGDASFLNSDSNIDNPSQAHRPGTLVNIDGVVYLVSPTGLLGIPDMARLTGWGYWNADIIPANAADRALTVVGLLGIRQAGEIKPSETTNTSSLKITNESMPDGIADTDYSVTFKASGGTAPYTFENYYTTHPCCYVSIKPSTGVFSNSGSGLKLLAGTWQIGIQVTDAKGAKAQKIFTWKVNSSTLKLTNTTMPDGNTGENYSYTFKASGGTAPYKYETYYITHPCCYLSINPTTGVFSNSGSGLKPQVGTWQVGIKATDAKGSYVQQVYTFKILPSTLKITTETMTDGSTSKDYSQQFSATGGKAPYTWSAYTMTHPCCYVGIDPSTGEFSNKGTGLMPLEGTWQVGIEVKDANGFTVQKLFNWKVSGN
jgi:hypothetical protein